MCARNTDRPARQVKVEQIGPILWRGRFSAMSTPCEVLIESHDPALARHWLSWSAQEAWRIEDKFSRFRADSVIGRLNRDTGRWMAVDTETDALLTFADTCWQLSEGLIDITIGGYLRHWRFDGVSPPPSRHTLKQAAATVGWQKVQRRPGHILIPDGMSLDFGGIGKEYAVDRIADKLRTQANVGGILVNLGGDIRIARARDDGSPWLIAVETIHDGLPGGRLHAYEGGIATSGSTKRFAVDRRGKRLGHILNPRTGWPVRHGPASVTVIADTATQAGLLATLAMLKGRHAETFLKAQGVQHYCQWPNQHVTEDTSDFVSHVLPSRSTTASQTYHQS